MKFKLLFFLVISFIIGIGASFADYEVIIEDVNYSGSYPSEGISMSITTNNDIVKAPTLTLKPDNPEYEDMIHAQIISCGGDNACIAKIEYDKELPTGKYTGKIIFTYQKNGSTGQYTSTGSYTLDIIQPDFEKDGVFVDDIIFDYTTDGVYDPSEGLDIKVRNNTDNDIRIKDISIKSDIELLGDKIKGQIINGGISKRDDTTIGTLKYNSELAKGQYEGELIIEYIDESTKEIDFTTGFFSINIIPLNNLNDPVGIFVEDVIFDNVVAGYYHYKEKSIVVTNNTDKDIGISEFFVQSDTKDLERMLSGWPTNGIFSSFETKKIGLLSYYGDIDAGNYTGELIIGYTIYNDEDFNEHFATGGFTLNAVSINTSKITGINIDFGTKELGYDKFEEKSLTIINPTDSDIEIKEIKLDTSDNPNINEIFEILDSALYTTLGQKEAADIATITMKKGLNVGLYTGKVEIIYQKDDKEYSIRSYLTGNVKGGGKEIIDELVLTGSLPKDGTKFRDYEFTPKFNKDYITLKDYEIYIYDETIGDGGDWVKVEDPEHIFNTSAEYSLKMYMEIDENYTIGENTSILYYFDRFTWLDGEYFDSGIWFYDCHFGNDPFVINVTSNNEDYGTVNTSRTKARFGEHITLTATPKNGYRFKKWQTKNNIEISDNGFEMIDEDVSIQAIFEPTPSHSGGGGHHKNIVDTGDKKKHKSAKSELELAYEFALQNGIDILDNLEESAIKGGLTRIAMAKMLSQYAINILGKVPANKIVPKYKDITKELNEKYDGAIELAYQLGIMGIGIDSYRPFDLVPRSEFVTALSRMLYGLQDGTENYYSTHIDKLKKEGILTNTNPSMQELKGYVLIMLMRSAKN